jgi:hypothetical protein
MKLAIVSIALWLGGSIALADGTNQPVTVKVPELRIELLDRTKTDQEARKALMQRMKVRETNGDVASARSKEEKAELEKLANKVKAVDEDNTKWLKGVVEKHGWPTNTLVGMDGANAGWLLVQHADHDPKFQRRCLDLMVKLPKDEVSQSNLAYLTDRVLLAEGRSNCTGHSSPLSKANGSRARLKTKRRWTSGARR